MIGPTLDFPDQVPYDAYVHASTLHSLQQPLTKDPGEMSFLMVSQVMELYFGLARYELRDTQRLLRDDDVWGAIAPLRRTKLHLEGLVAAWRGLRWMTPSDFNRFRAQLGEASGFQSAVYRHLEFLLGLKSEALIRPFKRQADLYHELTTALVAPSVWDDVTALLARRGFEIPVEVLTADQSGDYVPSPAVEAAWARIYQTDRADNPLYVLGEALTEVAEEFGEWRYKHLSAVLRTMGHKAGSGGSSGASWLTRSMAKVVFPELWSARTVM